MKGHPQLERRSGRARLSSAVAVIAVHLLLGYALLTGLGQEMVRQAEDSLKLFDVRDPPPPPPIAEAKPKAARSPEREGEAAPPNEKARPVPVVAPQPEVLLRVPPPIAAAPVPSTGAESSAGAATLPGPGTGAGGVGEGLGAGGTGSGTGGGGGGAKARQIAGRIANRDYPRAARKAGIQGVVYVRFTVTREGRAAGCQVLRSSGNLELDATTCQLIEQRYRYEPARDAQGALIPEVRIWMQRWWIEP